MHSYGGRQLNTMAARVVLDCFEDFATTRDFWREDFWSATAVTVAEASGDFWITTGATVAAKVS